METGSGSRVFGVEGRYAGGTAELRAVGRLVAGGGASHPVWHTGREWRGARRVEVNLAGVTALDAGGLGALLRLRDRAARQGVPVVIGTAAPRVRRVLQLTHLDGAFGLTTETGPIAAMVGGPLSRCA
jgi:ABC-type transporter Mla MlaB component